MKRLIAIPLIFSFLSVSLGVPFIAFASASFTVLTVESVARPSSSIPIGAQRVTMVTVQLTASCTRDVVLTSLTLHHKGLGDPLDVERVYALSEGVRRSRSTNASAREGIATLRFRGFKVRACTTVGINVLADFSATAVPTGQHSFEILDAADIVTDPPVQVLVNATRAPSVAIPVGKVVGSVSRELLGLLTSLSYGSARTVVRLRLRADARDDQSISAMTFTNEGTARGDDLQNLFLETSGHTRLSQTVPALDGDRVRVVLDPPLLLHRNEVRLVQLLGDIRASRRHTVQLTIQESADIESAPAPGR